MDQMKFDMVEREFLLVGESITANFPESFPDAAIKVQQEFESKMEQIPNTVDRKVLISPYMSNDIMVTYFACLEVIDLTIIPDGMSGFRIPKMNYARAACSNRSIDKAYSSIFSWIKENGLQQKRYESSFPIEIYYLAENPDDEIVEIYIPVKL
ncbi:AraC family transcriptional regulator [Rossellomorea vietnamensis]|uniref:AraC family transcriptional regulator n=1 Tax=Rossellomorea vietnamensis TaxID=218284 RepID=A0A5D4MC58_9BACI|nr:effector binding domain-containing protein [Rossellomorea vietnamensis]TYR99226.1 AraC family transcriptional regulator [Rossellomorea vietnamensis]